jgi:hypothetical protein
MGSWGPGVLQNDSALDFVGGIDDQLVAEMRSIDRPEFDLIDLPTVLAAAAYLSVLFENFGGGLPDDVDVRAWARKCLDTYDREIDEYGPKPEYRIQRREVIAQTFDKLAATASTRPRMDL